MIPTITDAAVKAAIAAIASESASTKDKIEMLIEMAHGFVKKPKTAQDLWNAIALYEQAEELSGEDYPLLKVRAKVGIGGALRAIPDGTEELLLQAKATYTEALPILQKLASPEEVAEAQMNYGLILQSLVPLNLAKVVDSIQAYQEALRVFTWDTYPQEYAILHNNIAIAYLSMSSGSQQQYLFEGLAVQSFEVALKRINLIEHPREYAMLQNNLGNALQYLPSAHPVDNLVRAIAAYNEALKVRNSRDTPLEYANTISNKANALFNLPDDLEKPEIGNPKNLLQARGYFQEAWEIFTQYGQIEQAEVVAQTLQELKVNG
ncbi:hypothetical protein ACF3DV_20600 [Chlorogloeopsis fritschii PCC 9212]|uniref:MalT-like TPR region domain-containing protein n=1 Tax=Chlorogloeopsis fritschii PCC 6912 TaxID=211165 RepID=A0A433NNC5_CHLFR|nr:hypothetical protein [Chlorogloeopsis fritschii]RUR84703.1 hypothetical protein PCC6912_15980 [Chlorogloeopsis fritschii PCC 6912]